MKPALSVVVLNFNRRQDLLELLASLTSQTDRRFETIVVDNASNDDSVATVRQHYPHVTIVPLDKNIGRAGHNEGVMKATGDVLVFLDADILLPADFLQKVTDKFKNKNVDAVAFYMRDLMGKTYGWEPTYAVEGSKEEGYESTFGGGMWAIRRTIFEDVGCFNPTFFVYVDEWEYLIRLWYKGYSVRYFPDLIGYHKESPYAYRSVMKGFHVIVNHAQLYALYLPVQLWPKFSSHHSKEVAKILATGEADRGGTLKGLVLALFYFVRALPKRSVLRDEALDKFMRFYFPQKGDVVVGKWGWGQKMKNEK